MIAIIDYGAGNLRSVASAFEAIGQHPLITNQPGDLSKAAAIVLPGVGAFGDGMESLRRVGLIEALQEEVLGKKKPYLGICLGLQFLGVESFEHGTHAGLGWLKGRVQRLVTPKNKLAQEFSEKDISPVFRANGNAAPQTAEYLADAANQ